MKKTILVTFAVSLVAGVCTARQFPFMDTSLSREQRAGDLISRMTVEEKISQLVNNSKGIERLGVSPYNWWSEALHGVARNGKATIFPQAIGMAATWDTVLVHNVASAISDEARAKFNASQAMGNYGRYAGITFWTPNINIFRDPRWGRGQETYGEDPMLTSRIGIAFVRGLQGDDPKYLKTAACAKHYAVHSGPEGLRHSFDVNPSKKDLFETYLPAFEALVKEAKVEAVMGAYNRVYGQSASGSTYLLKDILRDKWGFQGHTVSDCGAIADIYQSHKIAKDAAEASAIAVKAGLDLNCGDTYTKGLKEALNRGLITEADIDQLLFNLLMTRLRLGLFDPAGDNPYNAIPASVVGSDAHRALARKAAVESMVLLQNKGGVLPLDRNISHLYITGPFAADVDVLLGNYFGVNSDISTFLEGIATKVGIGCTYEYKKGIMESVSNVNPIDWVTGEAKQADAIIVVLGESGLTEGEEGDAIASTDKGDRTSIALPKHQIDFLRSLRQGNKHPLITVLTGGSPMDCRQVAELSDAVVMAWYPGQEGGLALADVLFGDAVPSGRLPVTFPAAEEKLPPFEDYSMRGRTYKYMTDNIMYPFGYGLSYTTFRYSALQVEPWSALRSWIRAGVTVSNTGKVAGEEVVQLYVSAPGAGISNPISTLVAFARVSLAPGESKAVQLTVPVSRLASVMEDGNKKLLEGDYTFTASGAAPCSRAAELGVSSSSSTINIKPVKK